MVIDDDALLTVRNLVAGVGKEPPGFARIYVPRPRSLAYLYKAYTRSPLPAAAEKVSKRVSGASGGELSLAVLLGGNRASAMPRQGTERRLAGAVRPAARLAGLPARPHAAVLCAGD